MQLVEIYPSNKPVAPSEDSWSKPKQRMVLLWTAANYRRRADEARGWCLAISTNDSILQEDNWGNTSQKQWEMYTNGHVSFEELGPAYTFAVIYCCYKQSSANTSLFVYGMTTSWSRLKWFSHEQMFLTVVLCSTAIKLCNKRQIFLRIKLLWAPPAASCSATKSRRPNTTTIWQKELIYHLKSCKISPRS